MAEHIALRFDWEEVDGSRVIDILGQHSRTGNDGSADWVEVAICLQDRTILLSVEPNTDQIEISLCERPSGDDWRTIPSFAFAIGQPLGWCWIGRNYRGYKDSFTLAFGGVARSVLEPKCMFIVEASSLSCFDLTVRKA